MSDAGRPTDTAAASATAGEKAKPSAKAGAPDTRTRILRISRDLVRAKGPRGLTFDAVAKRLGKSKQAVLYWFPTKDRLLAETLLPDLAAEAGAARAALQGRHGAGAVRAFVEAVAGFHLEDLERFRLVYLAPQSGALPVSAEALQTSAARVPEITAPMYADLAACLDGPPDARRREAVAIHAAVLGLILMVALTESVADPLAHDPADLVDALARRLAGAGA
jgi:AcrR family transcriptional regulator